MYVAQKEAIRKASRYMSLAVIFYILNCIGAAVYIFFGAGGNFQLGLAYTVACLLSFALVMVTRRLLDDYALDTFNILSIVVGTLGIFTGLVVGGILVFLARYELTKELEVF